MISQSEVEECALLIQLDLHPPAAPAPPPAGEEHEWGTGVVDVPIPPPGPDVTQTIELLSSKTNQPRNQIKSIF